MKKRLHLFIGSLTFLIPFSVYLFTLFPTVTNEDSGELIAAAASLGIAHPPGYPLLSFIGKIFTLIIPFGNIAWRLNVMSAFFSALTTWLIFLLIKKIVAHQSQENQLAIPPLTQHAIALFPALIVAFSVIYGSQAVRFESYPLNSFFILLLIHLTYQWHLNPNRPNLLYLMALILGLAAANHQIIITIAPAIALFVLIKNRHILANINVWLISIFLFILGLSFYLYLPIRSASNPALDWGNTEISENFWNHVTRGVYFEPSTVPEGFETINSQSLETVANQKKHTKLTELIDLITAKTKITWLFIKYSFTELNIYAALIGWLGLFFAFRKKYRQKYPFLIFLPIALLSYILIFWKLLNPNDPSTNQPFYIPIIIFISIATTYPLIEFTRKLSTKKVLLTVVLFILPIFSLSQHVTANNYRQNFIAYDVARISLHFLPPNAILYIPTDDSTILPIFYLQKTENFRPDVLVYDNISNFFDPYTNWPGWDKVHSDYPNRRIFTQLPTEPDRNFIYVPHTPFALEMASRTNFSPEKSFEIQKQVAALFENPAIDARGKDSTNLNDLLSELAAHYYLSKGSANLNVNYQKAQQSFQSAILLNPESFWLLYYVAHIQNFQQFYPEAAAYLDLASQRLEKEGILLYLESLYNKAENPQKALETKQRRENLYGLRN